MWRADDGTVNAWENRCPHRGVRLSVGTNLGDRLKCRYHGWTYASGIRAVRRAAVPSGREAAVPRPGAGGSRGVEVGGYVWVRLAGEGDGDPGSGFGADPGAARADPSQHARAGLRPAAGRGRPSFAMPGRRRMDPRAARSRRSVHGAERPRRGGRDPVRPSAGRRRRDVHPRRARPSAARGRTDRGPSPRERPSPYGEGRDRGERFIMIRLRDYEPSGNCCTDALP